MTAAVMTCLLLPWGTPFGIAALLAMLGSSKLIDGNLFVGAERQLNIARWIVLMGTVLGFVGGVVSWFGVVSTWQGLSVLEGPIAP